MTVDVNDKAKNNAIQNDSRCQWPKTQLYKMTVDVNNKAKNQNYFEKRLMSMTRGKT